VTAGAAGPGPAPLASGERVVLRRLVPGDEARLERFLRVPEVRRALRLERAAPSADAAFAAALVEGPPEGLVLGIAARDGGRLLGVCGLYTDGGGRQAELGIFIGEPGDWGKGYGTEATRLLVGHGFRALGLERIRLEVHDDHAAAIRAYERAGFRFDRPPAPGGGYGSGAAGRVRRLVSMSVLRSEWPGPGSPG
jgi:RimJ/RimL family protein N-acetyltransferase